MRVVLLITDLQPGGTPLRVVRWARWLPEIGVEPVVGCLAPPGPLSDELELLGIAHFACGARHAFDLSALPRLCRHLRRFDPHLIHSLLFHANLAARLIGRLDRRRPIITSTVTIEIERRWHGPLENLTARLSDRCVCNSPAVARHVVRRLHVPSRRVVVIPNGVDLDRIDASAPVPRAQWSMPAGAPLVAWVGRMDPVKDLRCWIEVFARVREQTSVCGLMIGDGPQHGEIERELRRRGLLADPCADPAGNVGRIHMTGWRHDVAGCLKSADLLLLTSRTEGSPNVVLEAMAAGCCVVASRVGGCRDLIHSGHNGLLCNAADAEDFARAVTVLCREESIRNHMKAKAREYVNAHESKPAVLESLIGEYSRVLSAQKQLQNKICVAKNA